MQEDEDEEERDMRKFKYQGKSYFLDVEDDTVYDENDEYVGDLDRSTGKVVFVDEE